MNSLIINPPNVIFLLNCLNTWQEQMAFKTCHDKSMKMLFQFFKKEAYFEISPGKGKKTYIRTSVSSCHTITPLLGPFFSGNNDGCLSSEMRLTFFCSLEKGALSSNHTPAVCQEQG
jgi:hypothetical protein